MKTEKKKKTRKIVLAAHKCLVATQQSSRSEYSARLAYPELDRAQLFGRKFLNCCVRAPRSTVQSWHAVLIQTLHNNNQTWCIYVLCATSQRGLILF